LHGGSSLFGQRSHDGVQDIHIVLEGVLKSRRVGQYNWTTVHCEFFGSLDLLRTRLEVIADFESGLARKIDELNWLRLGRIRGCLMYSQTFSHFL